MVVMNEIYGQMNGAVFTVLLSIPGFSFASRAMQCIFVPRSSGEVMNRVCEQISARQKWIDEKGDYNPILVEPEGMCSNGTCLLPYRKGAFLSLIQGYPIVIKYISKRLKPSISACEMDIELLLLLTNFEPINAEMIVLPPF